MGSDPHPGYSKGSPVARRSGRHAELLDVALVGRQHLDRVGGPELAAQAIRAGVVDEYHLFVVATVVGGGKRALPTDVRIDIELLDERRFGSGMVYLHYRPRV